MVRVLEGKFNVGVWGGYVESLQTINDGNWHHVAAVLPQGAQSVGDILLYIDGLPAPCYVSSSQTINTTTSEGVQLGSRIGGSTTDSYFQGALADIKVYSRALAADEVKVLAGQSWDLKELWRSSGIRGGTPGRSETAQESLPLPGSIVINEILAHSHSSLPDWVELYNTTNQNINIGGWFLSDSFVSDADRMKYRIPDGTILTPAAAYYVIEEASFNNLSAPGCRVPFALSEGGETLYLQSAAGEQLTGYFTKESFGASESGVTFGRYQKSTGSWNFVAMSAASKGFANAYPMVGPVIVSEFMYHPGFGFNDDDYEYIELMNISGQPVRTAGYVSTYTGPSNHHDEWIPWAFTEGIEFEFPVDLEIAAGQRILLVKDLAAFNARYTQVPAGTLIYEWTDGKLANEGETIEISMPGDKEYLEDRYYIRMEHINYDVALPWPQAIGTGKSLTHIRPAEAGNNYTNDPVHWSAENPTPGW